MYKKPEAQEHRLNRSIDRTDWGDLHIRGLQCRVSEIGQSGFSRRRALEGSWSGITPCPATGIKTILLSPTLLSATPCLAIGIKTILLSPVLLFLLHPVLPLGSKPFSYLPPFSFCYTLSCHWHQNHSPKSHASLSVWPNVTVEIKTWYWDELWFSSIRSQLYFTVVFPGGQDGKASTCGVGEQVQSLGREETLKKEIPTQARILVNPMDRGAWQATVHRVGKSRMWLKRQHAHTHEPHTSYSELGHSLPSHTVLGLNPISRVY